MDGCDLDITILGGGLAGGLIALALAEKRPELRLAVIEQAERFGGNHVWSFFSSDIEPGQAWLVESLIAAQWEGHSVRFPSHSRDLPMPYRSITSLRLDAALREKLPEQALLAGTRVLEAHPHRLVLAGGRTLRTHAVVDARGAAAMPYMAGGWQKFLGQTLRLKQPHGLERPIVMDARVRQMDGYRFVYCLPFSKTEILVEDTYYSGSPDLDATALRGRIADYATAQGWAIADVLREEAGVLPVIASGDFAAFWKAGGDQVAKAGARAALIHPLTGYSLPDAVRFACHLSDLPNLSGAALVEASYDWAERHWRHGRFYRMLTKMLFSAAQPQLRYRMLERFYRLPAPLIARFYAGRSTGPDAIRILAGRPPVPVPAAIASLAGFGRPPAPLDRPR